jgi:ribose 5-phosphate isomerase A
LSYDDAISALSTDALKFVKDGYVLGLGSGRAATAFVNSLSDYLREHDLHVRAVCLEKIF